MQLINISHPDERVTFREAVVHGLGRGQGLYFFESIEPLSDVPGLLEMDSLSRNTAVLAHLVGPEIEAERLRELVASALDFPVPCVPVAENVRALELFHGPSLAFKDFGARFMARCLAHFREASGADAPMTILTATSGDTGAAVAHAYHGQPGIRAVILYPKGKVTPLQEKLFCTLGDNITTLAVDSDFDCCQRLVKQAFDDEELRRKLGLNSANSINIARLLAQVTYYFEAAAQVAGDAGSEALEDLVFCVPSGNFGNLTAGLLARAIGLPYRRAIAATNRNDTVPRFFASGQWDPHPTETTITNAMDVSQPNNFPRVQALGERHGLDLENMLSACAVSDEQTGEAIRALYSQGYLADPHSALAWRALDDQLCDDENGVFLCTAHPAKFREVLADVLGIDVPLPPALEAVADLPVLSEVIPGEFDAFRAKLLHDSIRADAQLNDHDADHQEGDRQLEGRPDHHADPGTNAHAARVIDAAPAAQLTEHRADERPQDNAGQAEEHSDNRPDRRAPEASLAGAKVAGAERAGDKVNEPADYRKCCQDPNGGPSDHGEAVDPGDQEQAEKDQRDSGQGGDNRARQAGNDHQARKQPPKYCPVHRSP